MIHKTKFDFRAFLVRKTKDAHLLVVSQFIPDVKLGTWSRGYIPGKSQAGGGPSHQSHCGNLGGI